MNPALAQGHKCRLGPISDTQGPKNRADMDFCGPLGDSEFSADFFRWFTLDQTKQDLLLTRGNRCGGPWLLGLKPAVMLHRGLFNEQRGRG